MKNPGIAAVLSFFYPGLGQLYNGQFLKAGVFMVLQAINILLCFIIIGFVTGAITWIVAIFDAYKSAERINQAQEG
jgi:TM2 domain-containing membrane protein YozV